nr:histidine-rich glycoprotein-like [Parasteatoda tepidariorum]
MKMLAKIIIAFVVIGVVAANHHDQHHHEHHHPHPYKFGYEVKGKEGSHHRHEEGDGHGGVKGSYGYVDHHGIHREVHYVADKAGYRAEVKTNEPGTANQDPAHVKLHSHAVHHHIEPHHHHHHEPHHHHQEPHHAHHNHHGHHWQHHA